MLCRCQCFLNGKVSNELFIALSTDLSATLLLQERNGYKPKRNQCGIIKPIIASRNDSSVHDIRKNHIDFAHNSWKLLFHSSGWKNDIPLKNVGFCNCYRPPMKLREGNVFTRVCLFTGDTMVPLRTCSNLLTWENGLMDFDGKTILFQ